MRHFILSLCTLFVLTNSVSSASFGAAVVYRLVEHQLTNSNHPAAGLDFGFSGTITTDGSLGNFADTSPITSWSILATTPGESDGETTELWAPSNSGLGSRITQPTLRVTPDSISLITGPSTNFWPNSVFVFRNFSSPDVEVIRWEGTKWFSRQESG